MPACALRVLVAAAVGFGVARLMPHDTALGALAALIVGGLSYVAALLLVRELRAADMEAMAAVFRKPHAHD